MLTINEIKFDEKMITNGGKFILVELLPIFNNKESIKPDGDRIGTKAVVALTGHNLEKIEVYFEEIIACSPFNELELAEVTFSDFEGYFHQQNEGNDYVFSATASHLKLIK